MAQETPEQGVDARDVFDLLAITAADIDVSQARADQKHLGRQQFVDEVVRLFDNYNRANRIDKPADYYTQFKMVLSSRTNEVMSMIVACKTNDFAAFSALMAGADEETLRRMGQRNVSVDTENRGEREPFAGEDVVPRVMQGPRSFFDVVAGQTDNPREYRKRPRQEPPR